MKLRCYKCRAIFTLEGVPESKVPFVTESTGCPSCGAGTGAESPTPRRRHVIVEMSSGERLEP